MPVQSVWFKLWHMWCHQVVYLSKTEWRPFRGGQDKGGHFYSCCWWRPSLRLRSRSADWGGILRTLHCLRMGTSCWGESSLSTAAGKTDRKPTLTNHCHWSAPGKLYSRNLFYWKYLLEDMDIDRKQVKTFFIKLRKLKWLIPSEAFI